MTDPRGRDNEEIALLRKRVGREIIEQKKHKSLGEKHAFARELGVNISFIYKVLQQDHAEEWAAMSGSQGPGGRKRKRKSRKA